MSSRTLICALSLACGAAWAQQAPVIGTTTEVQGLVTISQASTLSAATEGSKITENAQVVTGSGSFVTVKLDSGCTLHMRPNQSLVVTTKKNCDELVALLDGTGDRAFALPAAAALVTGGTGAAATVGGIASLGTIVGTAGVQMSKPSSGAPVVNVIPFPPVSGQ